MESSIILAFLAFFAGSLLAQDQTQNQTPPDAPPQGWYKQHSNAVGNSGAIFFINRDTGWVTFGDGLFTTIDGGNTWTFLSPPPVYIYYFADANNGWGQNDTALVRTSDGGKSWTSVHAPVLGQMKNFGMDTIYIFGGASEFARSTNAGLTWTTSLDIGNTRSMSFADSKYGFTVGSQLLWLGPPPPQKGTNGASFWVTTNGGIIWRQKYCPLQEDIRSIYALDQKNLFASSGLDIVHSSDGGITWNTAPTGRGVNEFFFLNKKLGYMAGPSGIQFTNDSGQTWTYQYTNVSLTDNLNSIFFVDSLTGWSCGYAGVILHTINGGVSWVKQYLPFDSVAVQSYPEPALSPNISIHYTIPSPQHVTISLYDLTGKQVQMLLQNDYEMQGEHTHTFDIRKLPAGIYFLKFETERYITGGKITKIVQ